MSVSTVGIIGAGQMGAGVAQVAAQAGVNILLNDVSEEMCRRGLETVERNLDRMVQRGRLKLEERDRLLRRIEITHRLEDLASADFVLEAVVENEDAKIVLFQKLDKICPPDVIFASNTSSISITRMAARTSRADRFIGMHFMNPVPAMKLGTNQPMGPLELADLIGLDTCLAIMEVMHRVFGDDKYRPCPLLKKYVDAGYLGRKAGRGFYIYDAQGNPTPPAAHGR